MAEIAFIIPGQVAIAGPALPALRMLSSARGERSQRSESGADYEGRPEQGEGGPVESLKG